MLDVSKVHASSGSNAWDTAVHNASEEYKQRMVICFALKVLKSILHRFFEHPFRKPAVYLCFPSSTTFVVTIVTRMLPWH